MMSVAWSSHPRVAWQVADGFWFQYLHFVCSHYYDRIRDRGVSTFFQHTLLNINFVILALSYVLYIRNSKMIFCSKLPLFTNFITFTYMQLPEAPTFGWRDESLMASDMSSFCLLYHICMHDVSCLKLPPSGGVMSRWWLLILTSEFCLLIICDRIWDRGISTFFSTAF